MNKTVEMNKNNSKLFTPCSVCKFEYDIIECRRAECVDCKKIRKHLYLFYFESQSWIGEVLSIEVHALCLHFSSPEIPCGLEKLIHFVEKCVDKNNV